MQAQLDFCKVDPNYGIEDTAENVEAFFKEKLIRMFDQIQDMKQRIESQKLLALKHEKASYNIQLKHEQTQKSSQLVEIFKDCLEHVKQSK